MLHEMYNQSVILVALMSIRLEVAGKEAPPRVRVMIACHLHSSLLHFSSMQTLLAAAELESWGSQNISRRQCLRPLSSIQG